MEGWTKHKTVTQETAVCFPCVVNTQCSAEIARHAVETLFTDSAGTTHKDGCTQVTHGVCLLGKEPFQLSELGKRSPAVTYGQYWVC